MRKDDAGFGGFWGCWNRISLWLESRCKITEIPSFFAFLLFYFLLLSLHNSRALVNAEFWGEDGPVWYAEAYDYGILSLTSPRGGYLNSIQRIIGFIAQGFPFHLAPTIYSVVAIIIQILPAIYLVSGRLDKVWPDFLSRLLFSLLLVVIPNSPEIATNATNSQWHLALLAFIIIVSAPASSLSGRALENLAILVSGLSGPFAVIFTPIALLQAIQADSRETRYRVYRFVILVCTSAIQAALILGMGNGGRISGPLGATSELLMQIVAMIPLGATIGLRGTHGLIERGFFLSPWPAFAVVVLFAVLMMLAFWRGPKEFRQYVFFAVVMFSLALAKPLMSVSEPQWPMFLMIPSGNRYFFFPMLAWWLTLIVVATRYNGFLRWVTIALLTSTFLYAVPKDWGDIFGLSPTDFNKRSLEFESAPPGTRGEFSTLPVGSRYALVKKGHQFTEISETSLQELRGIKPVVGTCALDELDGISTHSLQMMRDRGNVSFAGWVLPSSGKLSSTYQLILADSARKHAWSLNIMPALRRDDVYAATNREYIGDPGFSAGAAVDDLVPARYDIFILINSSSSAELCNTQRSVDVIDGGWRKFSQ
jgi:hypothetical protein